MAAGGPGVPPSPFASRLRAVQNADSGDDESYINASDERAPLLPDPSWRHGSIFGGPTSYGAGESRPGRPKSHGQQSSVSSNARRAATAFSVKDTYDINNPPSVPASPNFSGVDRMEMTLGDVMIRDELDLHQGSPRRHARDEDALSDIGDMGGAIRDSRAGQRVVLDRHGEQDVCFPGPGMSEMGDEAPPRGPEEQVRARRRRGQWPDLSILEEWKHMEKEGRTEERRVKTITEPQLINGRLRPVRKGWYETDEDIPYRFTYFNEEFRSTIHSQTISELVQPGGSFQELFIPEPRVLSDDESDMEEDGDPLELKPSRLSAGVTTESRASTRQPSFAESRPEGSLSPCDTPHSCSGRATPCGP